MQLNLERPDYTWFLRGADGAHALVNDRTFDRGFAMSPDSMIEDWPVTDASALAPDDLLPLLALEPELIVLGTGPTQRFPPAAVMHACLSRGIGLETMDNAAAARTYSVLAGEGRRVVVAFVFPRA
ncbi:hypothetical protein LYSHEL_03650 [Lysobacter helvus]|uniref:Mth938-like domain-containing protein n=2 Tax=Lysobacteraceae TaxID=32033 RepID=A0ABM7Q2B9_9GAMM|nr:MULTISPECIES: MTH938/NDUFAF3 family protein [Lysobacter]BCT91341.1 hypothetical protein LYSCAS_03650 [Lysobacter caseinilyticus]BCT94494.1 hypothetical protein LYSHEL_03650 [Lysobacter helvus]